MKIRSSDITPESSYLNRRAFMAAAGAAGVALGFAGKAAAAPDKLEPNSFDEITNYNNFYEFGFSKTDPAKYAGKLTTEPWTVEIGGLVDRPGSYSVADIAPANAVEDRIYRLRCVEAWSMVIPWQGVPLAGVLKKAGVQSGARFVEFQTLLRPSEMPEQNRNSLDWPYLEGLRLDEAMHPLTLLATGLYGKPMPNQNGAPIRLVVPWKYGFKSAKSIVRISVTDKQPVSTWQAMQPGEYGFYANVNPKVDHPRWSQASERVIGAGLFGGRQETQMFNGYADEVAQLYKGMDLARDY